MIQSWARHHIETHHLLSIPYSMAILIQMAQLSHSLTILLLLVAHRNTLLHSHQILLAPRALLLHMIVNGPVRIQENHSRCYPIVS